MGKPAKHTLKTVSLRKTAFDTQYKGDLMKLIITHTKEVCRCGMPLSKHVSSGYKCSSCGSILDTDKCHYAHFNDKKPTCKPLRFKECSSSQCRRRYPYPLDNTVCRRCGSKCLKYKTSENTYFYYWPDCDYAIRELIHNSGIPRVPLSAKLDMMIPNNLNRALIKHIKQVAIEPSLIKTWVVIKGPTGSGKTTFAAILGKVLMRRFVRVRFMHLPQHLEECREMLDFKNPDTPELRAHHEELENSRVLIIDDLYTKSYSAFEKKQVYRLFWERDAKGLPTIITTQQSYSELEEALDEQTASRILGRSKFFISGERNMRQQPN